MRKQRLLPDNETINAAAYDYRSRYNCLPRTGYDYLPRNSAPWGIIIKHLPKERGITLKNLLKQSTAPLEHEKKLLPLPDDATIAKAADAFCKDHNGRLPDNNSGHKNLPEKSLGWAAIILSLRKERNITPRQLMRHEGYGLSKPEKKPKPERNLKLTPDDAAIAAAAAAFRKENEGKLPDGKSGHVNLPEDSAGWSSIINHLRTQRGTTLTQLTHEQGYERPEKVKARRNLKPMPDDATIAAAANAFRKENEGRLPSSDSGHANLPESSASWSVIIERLRARELTLKKIMILEGYKIAEHKLYTGKPKPFPSDAVIAAASHEFCLAHKGKLPTINNGHANLPADGLGWAYIIQRLNERKMNLASLLRQEGYKDYDGYKKYKPHKSIKRNHKPLSDEKKSIIAAAANQFLNIYGRLPGPHDHSEFLPEDSDSWPVIIGILLTRHDLEIIDILEQQGYEIGEIEPEFLSDDLEPDPEDAPEVKVIVHEENEETLRYKLEALVSTPAHTTTAQDILCAVQFHIQSRNTMPEEDLLGVPVKEISAIFRRHAVHGTRKISKSNPLPETLHDFMVAAGMLTFIDVHEANTALQHRVP